MDHYDNYLDYLIEEHCGDLPIEESTEEDFDEDFEDY